MNIGKLRKRVHDEWNLDFIQATKQNTARIIDFSLGGLELGKCPRVVYSNDDIGSDISFNVFGIKKEILGLYGSFNKYANSLKMFLPAEKIEYVDGFINVWWRKELLSSFLKKIKVFRFFKHTQQYKGGAKADFYSLRAWFLGKCYQIGNLAYENKEYKKILIESKKELRVKLEAFLKKYPAYKHKKEYREFVSLLNL